MRIAVVGSRNWNESEIIYAVLNGFHSAYGEKLVIVSGGARGVDTLAEEWAKLNNVETLIYRADWGTHGRSAGVMRNQTIIENADAVAAFWDGSSKGTLNTMRRAEARGLPLRVWKPKQMKGVRLKDLGL